MIFAQKDLFNESTLYIILWHDSWRLPYHRTTKHPFGRPCRLCYDQCKCGDSMAFEAQHQFLYLLWLDNKHSSLMRSLDGLDSKNHLTLYSHMTTLTSQTYSRGHPGCPGMEIAPPSWISPSHLVIAWSGPLCAPPIASFDRERRARIFDPWSEHPYTGNLLRTGFEKLANSHIEVGIRAHFSIFYAIMRLRLLGAYRFSYILIRRS